MAWPLGTQDTFAFDLSVAPEGALARLSSAINRPKKRVLGLLKLENEFIGVVRVGEFEIWERRQHAIHARGRVRGRRGGTCIEIRFVISTGSRILLAVFFALYVALAVGFTVQPAESIDARTKVLGAIAGAATLALIFVAGALRQRADLRVFVERLFSDVARM